MLDGEDFEVVSFYTNEKVLIWREFRRWRMWAFVPAFMPHGPMSSLGDSNFGRAPVGSLCVCECDSYNTSEGHRSSHIDLECRFSPLNLSAMSGYKVLEVT